MHVRVGRSCGVAWSKSCVATVCWLGAGCSVLGGDDDEAGASSTLRGTQVVTYCTDTDPVVQPDDDLVVLVPSGEDEFVLERPKVDEFGHFEVADVPAGDIYISRDGLDGIEVTTLRELSMNYNAWGRPSRELVDEGDAKNTVLRLDVENASAIGADDWVRAVSYGAAIDRALLLTPDIVGGSTIDNLLLNLWENSPDAGLVDGAAGDILRIHHLERREDDDTAYHAVASAGEIRNLEQTAGATVDASVALGKLNDEKLTVGWDGTAYGLLAGAVHPKAEYRAQVVTLGANPAAAGGHTSMLVHTTEGSADPGEHQLEFEFGDPFPAKWTRRVFMRAQFDVELAPGTDLLVTAYCGYRGRVDEAGNEIIGPTLSPPQSLLVDDLPAELGLPSSGVTPVVSWSPPDVGTASYYLLDVIDFPIDGEVSEGRLAWIGTSGTSVQIPSGVIDRDRAYVLRLTAYDHGPPPEAPGEWPDEYTYAATLSGLIVP